MYLRQRAGFATCCICGSVTPGLPGHQNCDTNLQCSFFTITGTLAFLDIRSTAPSGQGWLQCAVLSEGCVGGGSGKVIIQPPCLYEMASKEF